VYLDENGRRKYERALRANDRKDKFEVESSFPFCFYYYSLSRYVLSYLDFTSILSKTDF